MKRELLASRKEEFGISLDPRTKLAVLITIAVFILGGSFESVMQYYMILLAAIPLLLLLVSRKWKGSILYILIFGGSLCLEMFGLSRLSGAVNFIAVAVVGLLLRFAPGIVMGYFVVTTTTVSEFIASMEKLHLPRHITIPMSVMFRFFPDLNRTDHHGNQPVLQDRPCLPSSRPDPTHLHRISDRIPFFRNCGEEPEHN